MEQNTQNNRLTGLTDIEVAQRIRHGLTNKKAKIKSHTYWQILRSNLITPFNAILGTMLLIVLYVGSLNDALFGLVMIINSMIGIIQESRAKYILDKLSIINIPKVMVKRNNQLIEIATDKVVKDDLILLRPGDQATADGPVIETEGLEIDESILSGESLPILKKFGDTILSGSICTAGKGYYIAENIGINTYAQNLTNEVKKYKEIHSELKTGINKILKWVTLSLLPIAAILFYTQSHLQQATDSAAIGTIAGLVGIIPQGLVLMTSIAFAISIITLGRRNVLIEELPAVETLARVDVICFDKTGTLTDGNLILDKIVEISHDKYTKAALGAICHGSAIQNTTIKAISKSYKAPSNWQQISFVPFSSERKWSGATFKEQGNWLLGAPEILLKSSKNNQKIYEQISDYAKSGYRVLLLAKSPNLLVQENLPPEISPIAILLFTENLRDDAAYAVSYFKSQGVEMKVISGDNPQTVLAIASKAGINNLGSAFDARNLPIDDTALMNVMESNNIFGRVTPQQKRSMIKAMQSRGHVVGMTGDGVNDILALKDADIGIAMGSGTPAAKSIARLVLLDGKFSTLPDIVAEGRRIMSNIERVANLFLTKTVYVMLLIAGITLTGKAFLFLPRHLTLVSDLTIGIPAFFLALAPNFKIYSPGILGRIKRFVIPMGTIIACFVLLSYIVAGSLASASLEEARTIATFVLIGDSLWVLIILARPLNKANIILVASMVLLLITVVSVPFIRSFFALSLLTNELIALSTAGIITSLLLLEITWRLIIKRFNF